MVGKCRLVLGFPRHSSLLSVDKFQILFLLLMPFCRLNSCSVSVGVPCVKEKKVQPQLISFYSFLWETRICEMNKHTATSYKSGSAWAACAVSLGCTLQPKAGVTYFLHMTRHRFFYILVKELPG